VVSSDALLGKEAKILMKKLVGLFKRIKESQACYFKKVLGVLSAHCLTVQIECVKEIGEL
jgi:hypothetical protein